METEWVVRNWEALFSSYDAWIVGGLGSFVLHEFLYFFFYLPWLLADFIPGFQKYKVQPAKTNDWAKQWKCLKLLLFNHFVIELPLIMISHPIFHYLGIRTEANLIPSWYKVLVSCMAFLIIEDFYFYWIHRFLHWGALYQYIHKIHHHHAAPFGIAAEYAHPVGSYFAYSSLLALLLFSLQILLTLAFSSQRHCFLGWEQCLAHSSWLIICSLYVAVKLLHINTSFKCCTSSKTRLSIDLNTHH